MNTEFYEYILRERGRRDVDEDKDDSMCASLPHVYSPAQPARGTVSRRLRSMQYGEIMTRVSTVLAFFKGPVLRSFSSKGLRTGPGPVLKFTKNSRDRLYEMTFPSNQVSLKYTKMY